jgi:hypothetical protein
MLVRAPIGGSIKMAYPFKTFLISLCLIGCAVTQPSKIYPLPDSDVRVVENKIYYKNNLFAELRFYFTEERSGNPGEAYLFKANAQHRGIAIYYYKQEKLVWIYPMRGLEEDITKGFYTARGQSDGYFGWVYDVTISPDGKYVHYKTPGAFFESTRKYLVEYGVSK